MIKENGVTRPRKYSELTPVEAIQTDCDVKATNIILQGLPPDVYALKFHKRTGRKLQFDTKDPVGFNNTKVECFNCHKIWHFARDCKAKGNQDSRRRDAGYNGNKAEDNGRRPSYQDDSKALVTIDGEDINWSGHSVFINKESDLEDTPVNDRYAAGMHAVPPLMTGNYLPSGPDVEIDYSKFTYGPKQTLVVELDSKPSEYASCESDSSVETTTSMPTQVDNAPKKKKEKPSFACTDSVKYEKPSGENVTKTGTPNHCPNIEKQGRNDHTRKGLDYAFTRKACFVCGSLSHLIRDCDFHEKRMAKQAEFTKSKNKGGSVTFGGSNGRIIGKGKIKADRLLMTKPQNKTPYELLTGRKPTISYLRPYGCHVTILNTIDQLGKFDRKSDSWFLVGYSLNSKAFRVYNLETKRVEENLHEELEKLKRQEKEANIAARKETTHENQDANTNITNLLNDVSTIISTAGPLRAFNDGEPSYPDDPSIPHLEDIYANPKAVNTACYVLNRLLMTKPQNKTPYELLTGRKATISYLGPYGCHVTILNTIDQLGKFDRKSDLGFLVGYSLNSKAFRMFDLDYLTNSMNYEPVSVENQANKSIGPKEANNSAGTQANDDQGANTKEIDLHDEHFVLPIWSAYSTTDELEKLKRQEKEANIAARKETTYENQDANTNITNLLNDVSTIISTAGPSREFNDGEPSYLDDPSIPHLEDIYANPSEGIFTDSSYDDEGVVTDFNNLETTISQALEDKSWVDVMQEELLRFQIQKVWILVDLPFKKKAIGTKWVYRNKKDERGVVVRNKARLVAHGHRQEEGIDYDERNMGSLRVTS
nr:hypothetical protein [Tanacetum cinerariifolium]